MEEKRDEKLWRIAQERAHFRKSLYTYIVINTLLWFIWWFTGGYNAGSENLGLPWPAWVMLAWGFGLALNYYRAYHSNKSDAAEREYERLKRQKQI